MSDDRTWQVWSEGYAATGERSGATLLGTYQTPTFDDAVQKWIDETKPNRKWDGSDYGYVVHHEDGHWTYWACRLYDNETDARKSFG